MTGDEERSQDTSDQSAAAATAMRAPKATERSDGPRAEQSGRTGGLIVEALLFGWIFVRSFFEDRPVPDRTVAVAQYPSPEQSPGIGMPLRSPERIGRASDRDLDDESGAAKLTRRRRGTFFVVCSFAIGSTAGVGFVFAYWMGCGNLLLGCALALFFGGYGSMLVFYTHWLMTHEEAIGPREKLPSGTDERARALEDYCAGARGVQRRSLLKWMGAAGVGILTSMVISLMRSLGMSPYPSLFTTVWKRGQRLMTVEGKPLSVDSLELGSSVTVFPENSLGSENAQTVLVRVKEQLLQLPSDRANWAPMGYVAYSRVCTHAGCSVGLFESGTNLLLCPCHQSTFDVLRGAQPTGGPAARPLPQLPLYADSDGTLRAAGGFTEPPGPGFWGMR